MRSNVGSRFVFVCCSRQHGCVFRGKHPADSVIGDLARLYRYDPLSEIIHEMTLMCYNDNRFMPLLLNMYKQ